jgi:NAD(P)-dependent dehydrogenase (short-subunit alcohol dehydrogenase family)
VTDRDSDAAEAVMKGIVGSGGRGISVACDVTKESDLDASIKRTVDEFGKLTTLINNAGGGGPKRHALALFSGRPVGQRANDQRPRWRQCRSSVRGVNVVR